jgi:hypothetical protein
MPHVLHVCSVRSLAVQTVAFHIVPLVLNVLS